jgi:hypothetical protein
MLTDIQIQTLSKRRVDLPAVLGEHLLNRLQRPEHDPVMPADQTPPPVPFHHLRVQQLRQWHPARLGCGPLCMPACGVSPLAIVRQQRGHILPKAVGQEEGRALWSQNLGHVMDQALRHGQRAITDGDRQQQFGDGVHGDPHPMRGTGQPLYRVGLCDLTIFDGAEQGKQLIELNLRDMDVVEEMA